MKSERREFDKKMKRAIIFLCCYFVIGVLISSLLIIYTTIPQWLNGLIVILSAAVFYFAFLGICAIIDKKKEQKRKDSLSKNDPFAD